MDPGTKTPIEIVGVVRDFKYYDVRTEAGRQVFFPFFEQASGFVVYTRTSQSLDSAYVAARRTVQQVDANVPIAGLRSIGSDVDSTLSGERMMATMSTLFGTLATLLAVVGLYGVMSFTVARRTREIGVRMALGARAMDVAWMVMREALAIAALGARARRAAGVVAEPLRREPVVRRHADRRGHVRPRRPGPGRCRRRRRPGALAPRVESGADDGLRYE